MMKSIFQALGATIAALVLTGCMSGNSTASIPPVKNFKPDRYLGRWYEIARLPHSFENGMSEVYAEYSPGENNTIIVMNSGVRDGERKFIRGVARMKGASDLGELEVSFFRPFWGDYKIFYLSDDYTVAMVTSSTDEYFWILSRMPQLPQKQLDSLIELAKLHHFPVQKLIYPHQLPAVATSGK